MPVFIRRYSPAEGHNSADNFGLNIARMLRDMSYVATDAPLNDDVIDDFFAAFKSSVSFGDSTLSAIEQVFRLFCQFAAARSHGAGCFLFQFCTTGFTATGIAEVHQGRADRGSRHYRYPRNQALTTNGCVPAITFRFALSFLVTHNMLL